jgi:NADH-ubiquinone oxidoreductase chain 5
MSMSICFVRYFFISFVLLLFWGSDLTYLIDWNIIILNSRSVIMTLFFASMFLLCMGFVSVISSLVVLYSDDFIFGDLSIFRFIMSVTIPLLWLS